MGRPILAPAVVKPQQNGYRRSLKDATACRCDTNHVRRRGAKSFVDDLVLSRGVVLSRAELFCDLLRLSPMTRRFVRFRRTYLLVGVHLTGAALVQHRSDGLYIFSRIPTHFDKQERMTAAVARAQHVPSVRSKFLSKSCCCST